MLTNVRQNSWQHQQFSSDSNNVEYLHLPDGSERCVYLYTELKHTPIKSPTIKSLVS